MSLGHKKNENITSYWPLMQKMENLSKVHHNYFYCRSASQPHSVNDRASAAGYWAILRHTGAEAYSQ